MSDQSIRTAEEKSAGITENDDTTLAVSNDSKPGRPFAEAKRTADMTTSSPFWQIALAMDLGYHVREPDEPVDLRLETMPVDPFVVIGRLVIVTHLVLDKHGNSQRGLFGRRKRMHELRWLPRSPYRRL